MNNNYIRKLVEQFANAGSETTAFSLYNGTEISTISYPQFANDILKGIGYLKERGIRGQHIALFGTNTYECLTSFFAIIATGNVAVILNPALPAVIMQEQIKGADISAFCCEEHIANEWIAQGAGFEFLTYGAMKAADAANFDDISDGASDDTIMMMFTSGTTGKSKIVEITYENWQYSVENTQVIFASPGVDRYFSVLPMYHVAGMITLSCVLKNEKNICIGRGIAYLFADMAQFNPTAAIIVPSMLESLEKIFKATPDAKKRECYVGKDLKRIAVAGAAMRSTTALYMIDQGFTIEVLYGMTETTGGATWGALDADHIRSIGKPYGALDIRIQDGELLIKGHTVMKGYYKDPEETQKVIEDGWIHTGDMGYIAEDGYCYITGRKKNVIILSNGENVNPEEIEATFGQCQAIVECMVYSDGKGICADVYTEDAETVGAFVKEYNKTVPMYRQVYKVNYQQNPLEKTASGKIKRKENK